MRKSIISLSVFGLLFPLTAFAQQNKPDPDSVAKMQQLLNQSASQAVVQFNKTYAPPRTTSPTDSTTTSLPAPAAEQQQPVVQAPPPVLAPRPIVRAPQSASSSAADSNAKSPDITVSADKPSGSVGNIYASGSDQSNNSNANNNGIRY